MFMRHPRSPASTVSGSTLRMSSALRADDRVREFAVFGREQSAKAAADLRIGQFDQLQALDSGQKPPRLRLDPELAQARAGIVIGDGSLIARRDLLDAHDVDQEADQFVRLFGETARPAARDPARPRTVRDNA